MKTEQERVNNKPSRYQVVWHTLPQSLRQEVIVQLVKLLEKHILAQVEPPNQIRPEVCHD